jgi:hypothetical protein
MAFEGWSKSGISSQPISDAHLDATEYGHFYVEMREKEKN